MQLENTKVLEWKNINEFYTQAYENLFDLIKALIDEKECNIKKLKLILNNFINRYSYYLIEKEEIDANSIQDVLEYETKDDVIIQHLRSVERITEPLNKYPSKQFQEIRINLSNIDYKFSKLELSDYKKLTKEYYEFYLCLLECFREFISITSRNGFLPNTKKKKIEKTISYNNYQVFFFRFHELCSYIIENNSEPSVDNFFLSRRGVLSLLIAFYPYFTRKNLADKFRKDLSFDFLDNDTISELLHFSTGRELDIDDLRKIKDIFLIEEVGKINMIIKYLSFEFAEIEMTPRQKEKYREDPTGW